MGSREADKGRQPRSIRVDKLERVRANKAERLRSDKVKPINPVQKAIRPRSFR
jgi:hypothetical protein